MKWIDAKKEKPDADTIVLVYTPGANEPVWLGYLDDKIWRLADGFRCNATHWMPVPEPPKEARYE